MADQTNERILIKGNHAAALGAIHAGCTCYFGYPITPQNEVTEYMSDQMPKVNNGIFIQAESEVAAINMVMGAAAAGRRVMTSSSSPGISLKQEGISYIAMAELPALIMNVVRCGSGLGNIAPHQGDYFQATKGGGHGDYRLITLAPGSVQEMAEFAYLGLELSDKYRNPSMILTDGIIGQMMEGLDTSKIPKKDAPIKDWALTPNSGMKRKRNVNTTIWLDPVDMAEQHKVMIKKYDQIKANEVRWEEFMLDDAELMVVAIGSTSRVIRTAVRKMRAEGMKVGMFRPITCWPFPYAALNKAAKGKKAILTAELSWGQLIEDVALAAMMESPMNIIMKHGGLTFNWEEIASSFKTVIANPKDSEYRWFVS